MFEFINIVIYFSIYIGIVATVFFIISSFAHGKKEKLIYSDNELPKVSVVIPAYNEEKTISETIESISASDYPEDKFEIIVVDDGSRDNTLKIAEKFQSDKVKIFYKENGGKGFCFEFGNRQGRR